MLGVAPILRAIKAVESGDVDEEHFTVIGTDWDIEERTRAQLDRLGLGDLALDRRLATLSGGQIVSLGLAAQLLKQPDVLLLDEPTNNLDLDARHKLYAVLDDWRGCLLVVSHDRALLDRMDRIAELDGGEIRFHGGNFTEYEQAVEAEREVAEKNIRSAEQEVKREKREMQQARERAARRASNAQRNLSNAGPAEDLRGQHEAQRAGVRGQGGRHARGPARRREEPSSTRPSGRCRTSRRSAWSCRRPPCRRPHALPRLADSGCGTCSRAWTSRSAARNGSRWPPRTARASRRCCG